MKCPHPVVAVPGSSPRIECIEISIDLVACVIKWLLL